MDYKAAVFIGRFQPFHHAHLEVAQHGLKIAEKLIISIGSCHSAPTIKNPWSYSQRKAMILSCFTSKEREKIIIIGMRDYFYDDNIWKNDLKRRVGKFINPGDSIALLGNVKDSSSYYINYFPEWDFIPVRTTKLTDATVIRNELFKKCNLMQDLLPVTVVDWLTHNYVWDYEPKWTDNGSTPLTTAMSDRRAELSKIDEDKKTYGSGPFITTDAIVVANGHVLLVERKDHPGRGLHALPGGFLKPGERLSECAYRELREETGIRLEKQRFMDNIKSTYVFDHPGRSLRGRVITHGFYIDLGNTASLLEVKGNDDAAKAYWLPLMDLGHYEDKFHDDHLHIINHFLLNTK